VLRECKGCGRRFVPTGPQRFCEHSCYTNSLRAPIEPRFWAKVNKTSGCWLWTAATIRGYGQIALNRKPAYAHRLSWELAHGPIPDGLSVLHTCDVPLCVRPDHLFLGSQQDNLTDARTKGRLIETLPRDGKLTYEDRLAIFGAKRYRGVCLDLAHRYGVSMTTISLIRKGRFARRHDQPFEPAASPVHQSNRDTEVMARAFERVPSIQLPVVGEVR
jgi:hypothetical protein